MMSSEKTIFYFQLMAALFMGVEYFLAREVRVKMDGYVTAWFEGVKQRFFVDLKRSFFIAWSRRWFFLAGVLSVFSALLIGYLYQWIGDGARGGWVYVIMFSSAIFIVSWAFLAPVFVDIFLFVFLGGVFFFLPLFIVKCPKGGLAAVGFVFLMMSFGAQYAAFS